MCLDLDWFLFLLFLSIVCSFIHMTKPMNMSNTFISIRLRDMDFGLTFCVLFLFILCFCFAVQMFPVLPLKLVFFILKTHFDPAIELFLLVVNHNQYFGTLDYTQHTTHKTQFTNVSIWNASMEYEFFLLAVAFFFTLISFASSHRICEWKYRQSGNTQKSWKFETVTMWKRWNRSSITLNLYVVKC